MILSEGKSAYAMSLQTFLAGVDAAKKDLDYLEDFLKNPLEDFSIRNATDFCVAFTALIAQLDFMTDELATNEISNDGEMVYLSKDQVLSLSRYSDLATSTVKKMQESCKIDMEIN